MFWTSIERSMTAGSGRQRRRVPRAKRLGFDQLEPRCVPAIAAPEITVLDGGRLIVDENTQPVEFGSVTEGLAGPTRTFTVRNDGTATLWLGILPLPAGFSLTEPLRASLAPRASDTFNVRLDSASVGVKAGEIRLITNDPDENPFNFAIRGIVVAAPPNSALVNVRFANSAGRTIPAAAVGSQVFVRVDFRTINLPAGSSYQISHAIDGVAQSTVGTWGAGLTGQRSWSVQLGPWTILPGPHTAETQLDSTNTVTEQTEADNVRSAQFTPITFAPRFVSPIGGVPYRDWTIVHYVDLDPTTGIRDYHGGSYTYDRHDAIDLRIANFAAMERGVPVYAAAAGTVSLVHDGEFDRCTFESRCSTPANVVYVDHDNGWTTRYVHLRAGSIIVSPGQAVSAGQQLGLVGSSGWSGHPHLHFSVYYSGTAVETFLAPDAYWVSPWPYAGDTPGALDSGLTDHTPTIAELRERPIERASFTPGESALFWVNYHSVHVGDRIDFIWHRPNGSRYFTSTRAAVESSFRWSWSTIVVPSVPGEWRVRFEINGVEFATGVFVVTI